MTLANMKHQPNKEEKEKQFANYIIHEIQKNSKLQQKVKKIQERFTPKTTLQDKKSIYQVAVCFEWVFGLLGVALGLYLMYSIFLDAFLNPIAAIITALLFLGVWELGKHVLLAGILREKYVYKRTNTWFLMLNILMIGCSMWWSVQGIVNFNEEIITEKPKTTDIVSLKARHKKEIDSLNRASLLLLQKTEEKFNTKIQQIQRSTQNYLQQVTYKGSINVHNTANQAVITNSSNRITNIEQAQKTTLEKLHQDKEQQLSALLTAQQTELAEIQQANHKITSKADRKNENRYWNLLWVAFIGDVICAIAIWYRVFHLYRGLREIQEAEEIIGAKIVSPTLSFTVRKQKTDASIPPVPLTKKETKIYKMYVESNYSLTKTQMHKSTGISRTIIDQMFIKTGITYHKAQPKKVSSFPKGKSVQLAT